ncbi:MAG TPA: histidine kinase [Chitinophagaceae bacterium]|nr:histidine kinase [Chitinophagaceae bacterium]
MGEPNFINLVALILFSALMLVGGLYLLAKFHSLFRRWIRNEWARKNITVVLVAICIDLSLSPFYPDFRNAVDQSKLLYYYFKIIIGITAETVFVFNIPWLLITTAWFRSLTFRKRMTLTLITIISSCMLAGVLWCLVTNKGNLKGVEYNMLYSFYTGCMTGLIYVTMSYVDLDKKRKLNEKELEVSRLQALKTKAELDVLHSKINPHFLYNALNSIADLSVTDGKKARKMTVALADLFRYSINYSDHNFSTVKEELEMAEVYLQIEKIRFEDKLNYTIQSDEASLFFLVPRFVLQTLVENAVKHGLKATGQMTEILIEVKIINEVLAIAIVDNGPPFPDEIVPGYGIKSVYDKLDLLFPGQYSIHFINQPRKQVLIQITKLVKNEPRV